MHIIEIYILYDSPTQAVILIGYYSELEAKKRNMVQIIQEVRRGLKIMLFIMSCHAFLRL